MAEQESAAGLDQYRISPDVRARFNALIDPVPEGLTERVAQGYRNLFAAVYSGSASDLIVHVDTPEELSAMQQKVHSLFSINTRLLNPRSAAMMAELYGLVTGERKSYGEVGKIFGVTGARISQIRGKVLRVLRHPVTIRKIPPTFIEFRHSEGE